MKKSFTTIGGTLFESNESQTYFYATWTDGTGTRKTRRIKKSEFEQAEYEHKLELEATEKLNKEQCEANNFTNIGPEEIAAEIEKTYEQQELKAEIEAEVEKKTAKKRTRKSKDIAYEGHGVTLTAKQVDFIRHLPDTCFWQEGLESTAWTDVLADEIKGQFAGKPMTVGAMISTICEKGVGYRGEGRVNNKKCTYIGLTEMGKLVAKDLGLAE